MKVHQLRAALDRFPDDVEVRILSQPRYPIEHGVAGVCAPGDLALAVDDGEELIDTPPGTPTAALLVEGEFHGYGTGWPAPTILRRAP